MERSEQQGRTGGITPHLTIRDRKAADAIEFYKKAFGAEELMRHPTDDGRLTISDSGHFLRRDGSELPW